MNNNEIKVSVIVPIYNVEKYLEECIASIENQTYENIEIILVNDGSTDSSLSIANTCKSKNNKIEVFNQKNSGQGSARNLGISKATGKYIMFVDSDDIIDSLMIEVMVEKAEKEKLDIIECSYQEFTKEKNGYVYHTNSSLNKVYLGVDYYECMPLLSPCNKLYNSNYIKKINFKCTENRYAEDVYDISTLILKANRIMRIDNCFYFYRRDNVSSTRNNSNITHKIKLGTDKLYISYQLNNLKKELKCRGYISNVIVRNILGAIMNKNYFFNKIYRKNIKKAKNEYSIDNVFFENVNIIIIFKLFWVFIKKTIIKKD